MPIDDVFILFLDSVARTSPVLIVLAGILASESTSWKLITAAVQRRIYTGFPRYLWWLTPTRTDRLWYFTTLAALV